MTPLERLYAEAIPDGTFGGPRTPAPPTGTPAAHRTALEEALAEIAAAKRRRRHHHPAAPTTTPQETAA